MFVLYAVLAGVLIGFICGGRAAGLASIQLRWTPLIVAGMAIQALLFAEPVAERIGPSLGPVVYVGSTCLVLAAVVRNWRVPGLAIVALGALSNLAAIVANGGYMPASADAMAAQGRSLASVYSNSTFVSDPALAPLTDVFAMPTWIPFANVFSIGDVLIGVGIAVAIVVAMRRPPGMVRAGT